MTPEVSTVDPLLAGTPEVSTVDPLDGIASRQAAAEAAAAAAPPPPVEAPRVPLGDREQSVQGLLETRMLLVGKRRELGELNPGDPAQRARYNKILGEIDQLKILIPQLEEAARQNGGHRRKTLRYPNPSRRKTRRAW